MKFYRIECKSDIEDIQFETLRDNQLNIASFSVPIGIESSTYTNCKFYEVEREGNEEITKEVGFINIRTDLDEAKLKTKIEASERLFELLLKL